MRERLLAAFLAVTALTLVLFGAPRAYIVADRAREAEARDLQRIATTVAGVAATRLEAGSSLDEATIADLLGPGDTATVSGGGFVDEVVVGSSPNPALSASAGEADGVVVTVTRSDQAVRARVREALTSLALIGLGVTIVSAGVAFQLARSLARPFVELADDAHRLGHGDFDVGHGRSRVAEAVAIRTALRESAMRLRETLRQEREFAANASHQLRTPLAGLRLRLEDLQSWPQADDDVRDELQAAITEVDRLAGTVSDLLTLARRGTAKATPISTAALLRSAQSRWRASPLATRRPLVLGTVEEEVVEVPVGSVEQVLDVLVHNALVHGRGTVTLEALAEDRHVRLRVRDEGRGLSEAEQQHLFDRRRRVADGPGEGIGLSLARDLAANAGGRLLVGTGAPTRFDLVLPLTPPTT